MNPQQTDRLAACRILICRPQAEAEAWADTLRQYGAQCQVLPCLEIESVAVSASHRQLLIDLDHFDKVIVTSQHAARFAFTIIDDYWPQLPVQLPWFAIGRKTAHTLRELGVTELYDPTADLTSEALLQQPLLQTVQAEKILLLKGCGGRQYLQNTLEERGALVSSIPLYARRLPSYDDAELRAKLLLYKPNCIVALSGETIANLCVLAKRAGASLQSLPLVVPSKRVAEVAREHGFQLLYILPYLCANELAERLPEICNH